MEHESEMEIYYRLDSYGDGNKFCADPYYAAVLRRVDNLSTIRKGYLMEEEEKGFCIKEYDLRTGKLIDKKYSIDDSEWFKGERLIYNKISSVSYENSVFLHESIFEYYLRKIAEDRILLCQYLQRQFASIKENNTLFQVIVTFSRAGGLNSNKPDHLDEICTYVAAEKESHLSCTVSLEDIQFERMEVFCILRIQEIHRNYDDFSEKVGNKISVWKPWHQIRSLFKIHHPEVGINDGGTINCGGMYTAIFVPFSDYRLAKEHLAVMQEKNPQNYSVIYSEFD
jgi:hypothetical protein